LYRFRFSLVHPRAIVENNYFEEIRHSDDG